MKRNLSRILCLLIGICVIFLSGCQAKQQNKSKQTTARGRYIENDRQLPDGLNSIYALTKLGDNSIMLVGSSDSSPLVVYSSTDEGKSWQNKTPKTAVIPSGKAVSSAAVGSDGSMIIGYGVPEMAGDVQTSAFKQKLSYLKLDKSGKSTPLNINMPSSGKNSDGWANNLTSLKIAPNGDLFGIDSNNIIYQIDPNTGSIKNTYSVSGAKQYGIIGTTLLVLSEQNVAEYNITSGNQLQDDKVLESYLSEGNTSENSGSIMTAGNNKNEMYFSNTKGLYRYMLGGNMVEQLVDGSLCTLGAPLIMIEQMVENPDGTFLILYENNQSQYILKSYGFSKDAPATPSNEITVYSLTDNTTVRQQIANFESDNPNIHVNYETGITGNNGVTSSDAIKTLNTQILSGNGPDVLILDGLPVQSYTSKGLLLDLSGTLSDYTSKDELFGNILDTYKNNNKLYAAPMYFKIPVINAREKVLNQITDFDSLCNFAQNYRSQNPNSGDIAFFFDSKSMMEVAFPVVADSWFNSSGSLNEDKLTQSMEQLKNFYQAEMKVHSKDQIDQYAMKAQYAQKQNDVNFYDNYAEAYNVFNIVHNLSQVNAGMLDSFNQLAEFYSANKYDSTISFNVLDQNKKYYAPESTVGISSKTKNANLSEEFVKYLFSEKGQTINYALGFPVNKAAFADGEKTPSSKVMSGLNLGRTSADRVTWPTKAQLDGFTSLVESLKTPTMEDKVVLDEFNSEFSKYADGQESLEQAANNIMNQLNIYLSEQGR